MIRISDYDEQKHGLEATAAGLCNRVTIDLQKLVACQMAADDGKGAANMLPSEKASIRVRTQEMDKYSGRVNLVFRSNSCLRCGLGGTFQHFSFYVAFFLTRNSDRYGRIRTLTADSLKTSWGFHTSHAISRDVES